jgi:hypothetical protein
MGERLSDWRLALPVLSLLVLNTLVLGVVDVVGMSGFVSEAGTEQLPWLFIFDMVLVFIGSSILALLIDSMPRVTLASWLLAGFTVVYGLVCGMFILHAGTICVFLKV